MFGVESVGEIADRLVAVCVGGVDEEREARWPPVGGVKDGDDQVEVLAQDVGVVGL